MYPYWQNTAHAGIFTEGIDGLLGAGYSVSCLKCHTVGYDTNAATFPDNGFYATQIAFGWTFPTNLANTNLSITNFASMEANYPNVAALANIQCENCHGPASEHANIFGDTNATYFPRLTVTTNNAGACNQCHDDPTHHVYGTQWLVSAHAGGQSVEAAAPSGPGDGYCVQCHSAYGFLDPDRLHRNERHDFCSDQYDQYGLRFD